MIIDFHTHLFPDKVAPKAIPKLADLSHSVPSYDGTKAGLYASMQRGGIDVSVILPVVTAPHQFDSILRFAEGINHESGSSSDSDFSPRLISFAGIHPDCEDIKGKLAEIKRRGFQGIKLHPYYQGAPLDDPRNLDIIDEASGLGLIVSVHAGYDPYDPSLELASPDMILHILKEIRPPKMVLAHMGSNRNYEESLEKLCGQNVYMDTGFVLKNIDMRLFARMVHTHGADRIVYGSDGPWTDQRWGADQIMDCPFLSTEEKQQILYKNALGLLSL